MKVGAWSTAFVTLAVLAQPVGAQTPTSTGSLCIDGGRIATEVTYDDGSRIRVLERTAETLRYENITAKGIKTTSVTSFGLVTLSATSAAGTVTLAWQGVLQGLDAQSPGTARSLVGTLRRPDGTEAKIGADLQFGASDVIEIDHCNYPVIKVTTVTRIDGKRSKIVGYLHEKSMLSLRTVVVNDLLDGSVHEVASFRAVSIK